MRISLNSEEWRQCKLWKCANVDDMIGCGWHNDVDDMTIIAETGRDLQQTMERLDKQLKTVYMKINMEKIKTMIIVINKKKHNIGINGNQLERVKV